MTNESEARLTLQFLGGSVVGQARGVQSRVVGGVSILGEDIPGSLDGSSGLGSETDGTLARGGSDSMSLGSVLLRELDELLVL